MLAGTFMSVFLVGTLYYLLAMADSILLQERLQDAADVSAFEASVGMARAMNFVALINTTMVTLTASLMSGNLLVVAGLVCADIGALPEGGCDAFNDRMQQIEAEVTPPLHDALRASTRAAEDIVETTPDAVAQRVATRLATEQGELIHAAFLVPYEMPIQQQGTGPLCALANLHQFRLVELTIGRGLMEQLIGNPFPRIGRAVPQCEDVPGAGALVAAPLDLPVGSEPYQLRVVIVGDTSIVRSLGRGVWIGPASLGVPQPRNSERDWVEERQPDRMLVMSQAEYLADWDLANLPDDTAINSMDEEAFRMRWRGRLRRIHVPTGADLDDADADQWRRDWIQTTLLPACGAACEGLGNAANQATLSLH